MGAETTLLFFLTAHWRSPIDFSDETDGGGAGTRRGAPRGLPERSEPAPDGAWERFVAVLEDDFNTPQALASMHDWRDHDLLRRALDLFGLSGLAVDADAPAELHELARRRREAREARDFDEADRLRAEIEAAGWEVRDDPGGFKLVPRQ